MGDYTAHMICQIRAALLKNDIKHLKSIKKVLYGATFANNLESFEGIVVPCMQV